MKLHEVNELLFQICDECLTNFSAIKIDFLSLEHFATSWFFMCRTLILLICLFVCLFLQSVKRSIAGICFNATRGPLSWSLDVRVPQCGQVEVKRCQSRESSATFWILGARNHRPAFQLFFFIIISGFSNCITHAESLYCSFTREVPTVFFFHSAREFHEKPVERVRKINSIVESFVA